MEEKKEMTRRDFLKKTIFGIAVEGILRKGLKSKNKENKESKEEEINFEEVYKHPEKFSVFLDKEFDKNFNSPETKKIFEEQSFTIDKNSKKIFFADFRKNTANIFNPKGEFIKTFGREGKGPGGLFYPVLQGIFSDKLFIKNFYSSTQTKIDRFDLEGNFKMEKNESLILKKRIESLSVLGDNMFFLSFSFKEKGFLNQDFMSFSNGDYKTISSHRYPSLTISRKKGELPFHSIKNDHYFSGKNFLVSKNDFAIFSHSEDNFIQIIDKNGQINKIYVFSEEDKEEIIDEKHSKLIKEKEKECSEEISEERYKKLFPKEELKQRIKKAREQALETIRENRKEYLPYYNKIIIDSQENILFVSKDKRKVFAYKLSKDKKNISKIGDFGEETELGKKIFSSGFLSVLSNNSIFGFWKDEDEEEKCFKKFNIKKKD